MFNNSVRKGLKAWVRFDGNNNAVAGSLIFQKDKPKVGKWKEYQDVNLCCPATPCTCDGNFNWNVLNVYEPPFDQGFITFPNHIDGAVNLNPNLIGQPGYELYINNLDINGNNQVSFLNLLVGNSGYITLIQGTTTVTYGFTEEAFGAFEDFVYYDDTFEGSTPGSLQVVSPAVRDFNTTDCITVLVNITEPFVPTTTTTTTSEPTTTTTTTVID